MKTLAPEDATKQREIPPAPHHLSKKMREFWSWLHINNGTELTNNERLILAKAAEAYDESERCRRIIKKEGMTVLDRFQQRKPHPLLRVEMDSRAQFAKLLGNIYLNDLRGPSVWP